MGPKSIREGDSPAVSSFLLPQLRHSRRGSLASLSSANQPDREALSHALDQIHSTASQTETLTTFNEYTSPPSSSAGPDTKGIASELQGGLSGLYSRFRASVGNVKDIVKLGVEDGALETPPLKSPRSATYSPKPLSKNGLEFARNASSSNSTIQDTSTTGSGRQSPLGNLDMDGENHETRQSLKPSTKSLGSTSISAKPTTASLAALKLPPVTLTQASQLSTISPALADVNVSAVKHAEANADPVSAAKTASPTEPQRLARKSQGQSHPGQSHPAETFAQGATDVSDVASSDRPTTKNSSQSAPKQQRDGPIPRDTSSAFGPPDKSGVIGMRAASTDSVRPFPDLEDGHNETASIMRGSSPDTKKDHLSRPDMVVTNYGKGEDDIFSVPDSNDTRSAVIDDVTKTGGRSQQIKIPLRKTMAPPLITRSHSSNLSLSRASTSDTESLDNSPLPTRSRKFPAGSDEALPTRSIDYRNLASAATHRDPKTMNVFSQVKNKVLNKEYWMKDENARDCFYCGDSFSTFRRKHHCSKSYCIYVFE